MHLRILPLGPFQTNGILLWNADRQALVVDPAAESEKIQAVLKEEALEPIAYLCTHAHADHINALADLHRLHPAPILMHSKDWDWAFSPANQIPPHYPVPTRPSKLDFYPLESQKEWCFAGLSFQPIHTPGHTPGSICFYFSEHQLLLSGDTLFKGSCGRTDLPGGSARQIRESLNRLKQLPDETRVHPGHGSSTTLAYEKATNFFMQ